MRGYFMYEVRNCDVAAVGSSKPILLISEQFFYKCQKADEKTFPSSCCSTRPTF